jgi:hypothetical protein
MGNNSKTVGNGQAIDLKKVPVAVWNQLAVVLRVVQKAEAIGSSFDSARAREMVFSSFVKDDEGPFAHSLLGSFESWIPIPERRDFPTHDEWEAASLSYREKIVAERRACITYDSVLADAKAIFPEADDEDLRPYVEKEAARRANTLLMDLAREEEEYAESRAFKESRKVRVSRDETGRPVSFVGEKVVERHFSNVYQRLRNDRTAGAWGILSCRYSSRGPRNSSRRSRTAVRTSSQGGGGSGDDSGGSEPPQGDPDLPSRPLIGGYPLVFPSQPDRILPSWRPARLGLMSHALLRGWSR